MRVTIFFTLVNIAGNFFATYVAQAIGHRRAFQIMVVGALLSFCVGFAAPPTLTSIYIPRVSPAFFSLGLFGLFPMYIPPQFPTLVRTLGAGITYNTGRLIAGLGAFFGGAISAHAGGPHKAIFWTGFLYIAGIAVALFLPEIPGQRVDASEDAPPMALPAQA
jgi:MFS family permease